ncbi:MAG: hypothetical protein C3F18_12415 [Nitrosomonadales bacterium]|nr:MAG: hypothetical protein C3F18_12415 [Nitrosomonadales bacterium]
MNLPGFVATAKAAAFHPAIPPHPAALGILRFNTLPPIDTQVVHQRALFLVHGTHACLHPAAESILINLSFPACLLLGQLPFLPRLLEAFLRQHTAGIQKAQTDRADTQELFACHLCNHHWRFH